MTDHTELRDRIRRAVYERLAHGPSAPDVLDPIADAAMSVIAPELERERALREEAMDTDRIAIDYLRGEVERLREVRAVLDRVLPTITEGTGRGPAADVELIASQRDEARAELDRLRAAATEVRRHWLSQWPSSRHAVRDVSPPLHDAIDTLAARSQAAADRTCTRPLVDRVQVFYGEGDDEVSEVIEAPRAQTHPTEETR